MKLNFYPSAPYFFAILLVCSFLFTSCEKIPGHTVDPLSVKNSGSTGGTGTKGCPVTVYTGATPSSNGVGPIAVGATNTIIFQVNNDSPVTVLPAAYPFVQQFLPTGSPANGPQTVLTALDIVSGNNVDINYNSFTTGIYNAEALNITIPPYTLLSVTANAYLPAMGTEKFNITTQNIVDVTKGTGTVKGTFDGFMVDSCMNKVRVAGSFNFSK